MPLLLTNLLIHGAVTGSRNSLTQAIVADSLVDTDRDAAFSLYYFIGFISGPVWALLTGFLDGDVRLQAGLLSAGLLLPGWHDHHALRQRHSAGPALTTQDR